MAAGRTFVAVGGAVALLFFGPGVSGASALQLEPVQSDLRSTPHHKLYDMSFLDERSGWVVGSLGVVLHSLDGGRTWARTDPGTVESLFSVSFVDENRGWVAGANGTVLATADQGRNWIRQEAGTREQLFSVRFLTPSRGLVAGSFGTLLETDDGGATWRKIVLDWPGLLTDLFEEKGAMQPHLYDVFFSDARRGWVAGEFGIILHTEDGGRTWSLERSGTRNALYKLFFADARRGWVVGQNGALLVTTDGGTSWAFSDLSATESLFNVTVRRDSGLIVGERGAVFGSRDAGQTWTRLPTNPVGLSSWIQALSPSDEEGFLIAGDRGALFHLRWP